MQFVLDQQQSDGSWFGRWGVNYLYGTFLVLRGLEAMGMWSHEPPIVQAAEWIRMVQNADGGYRYVDVPALFRGIDSRVLGEHVAVVALVFLVCAGLAWLALARHRWGQELYAIGGNEEAARLSGIPVAGAKMAAYAACGLLAGVAGLCQAAQEQQGDPEAGVGYELTAIAMVVIGGTSLMGGRGGLGLTLIGVLTIGYLEKILSVNAVPEAGRLMLTGLIVVAAVVAQRRGK